ncbi:SET domain-containing protein [Peniophora sp. CONT]|nr:SET domain-containing protein [Peniophora sp. CONT]
MKDEDSLFVCNAICHGSVGRGCGNKYKLSPREDSIAVVEQTGMGLGVRASNDIQVGYSIGVYSGEYKSALEVYEAAKVVEIGRARSLGVSAYVNRLLDLPRYLPDDNSVSTLPTTASEDISDSENERSLTPLRRLNGVLAAHVVSGVKHLLIDWEGHKVPTWIPDDPSVTHEYSCTSLRNVDDDDEEFMRDVGPESFIMYAGDLRAIACHGECETDPGHKDGLDGRVYVDASRYGTATRYINHSCEPNLKVAAARLGSHAHAFPVPLVITDDYIRKGDFLSFSYWHLEVLTETERRELRKRTPVNAEERHVYNCCKCGSTRCTGWISLPPRAVLEAAGVSEDTIRDLWMDREYSKPVIQV